MNTIIANFQGLMITNIISGPQRSGDGRPDLGVGAYAATLPESKVGVRSFSGNPFGRGLK